MKAVEKVLDVISRQGDCPRWHPQSGSLYWLDTVGKTLNAWQIDSDRTQVFTLPNEPGCFSFCLPKSPSPESILVATRAGFLQVSLSVSGKMASVVRVINDNAFRYSATCCCDSVGRLWVGRFTEKDFGTGSAWIDCLGTDLAQQSQLGPFLKPAGIGFSPDCDTIYYTDAEKCTVYACEYDVVTGEAGARRVFHRFSSRVGVPVGAVVDSEGCYWVAMFAGGHLVRLSPGGVIVEEIALPVKYPTSLTFGAANNDTLFITSCRDACSEEELEQYPDSGTILAFKAGVTGLPDTFFQPIRSFK